MKNSRLTFLIFGAILLLHTTANAQTNSLRGMVAVVRPVFSESTTEFLNKLGESLKDEGYQVASDRIKSYAKSGFGSGFVYTNPQTGQNYIITNRHVVIQAQSVNVEFMMEDQSVRTFNKCKIIAIDDEHDLAIIALPTESKFDKSLTFMTERPEDGTDVFTAGYPGLGSDPSWQFGKGIVSNSNLHVDEIMIGNLGVIQHTAQVDAGSSGGPLLIKSKDGGYQVVGMNTWKAEGRENVNIAIPSAVIMKFVTDYFNASDNYTKDKLEQRITELAKVTNDGYKKILPFVSYDYISHISVKAFFNLFHSSKNDKVKDEVIGQFKNGYPVEGVRIMIAEAISKQLNQKLISVSTIENFSTTEPVSVTINYGDNKEKTSWIAQQGHWMLENFPSLKLEAEWQPGISGEYGYSNSIFIYYTPGNSVNGGGGLEGTYQGTLKTYVTYGLSLNLSSTMLGGNFTVGGQLPYRATKSLYLIPFVRGFVGMDLGFDGGFYGGIKIGGECAVHLVKDSYFILGLGLQPQTNFFTLDSETMSTRNVGLFFAHAAITF